MKYDGLPPLGPKKSVAGLVAFVNVGSVYRPSSDADYPEVQEHVFTADQGPGVVIIEQGQVVCSGTEARCLEPGLLGQAEVIDLRGGSVAPGLTTYGSALGLEEIAAETSTNDGYVFDPLSERVPSLVGQKSAPVRAADGLEFGTRDALLAYRSGVVSAVVAPRGFGFTRGLSVHFSTGASSKLEEKAVLQEVGALHVAVRHLGAAPSVSTQIGVLRKLLLDPPEGNAGQYWKDARQVCSHEIFQNGHAAHLRPLGQAYSRRRRRQRRYHCIPHSAQEGSRGEGRVDDAPYDQRRRRSASHSTGNCGRQRRHSSSTREAVPDGMGTQENVSQLSRYASIEAEQHTACPDILSPRRARCRSC